MKLFNIQVISKYNNVFIRKFWEFFWLCQSVASKHNKHFKHGKVQQNFFDFFLEIEKCLSMLLQMYNQFFGRKPIFEQNSVCIKNLNVFATQSELVQHSDYRKQINSKTKLDSQLQAKMQNLQQSLFYILFTNGIRI